MDDKILNTLDILLPYRVKKNLASCIPACSQPMLATIKNPSTITPLMVWVYDRLIRRYTLDTEENNIPTINRIPYIKPIAEMEWGSQLVVPDWGDLGIYRWNVNNNMSIGHSVIMINMHQIRYARYAHMLAVLKTLTINTMCSALTKNHFSPCITHILIQHLECLPSDNVCEFMSILESTMGRIRVNMDNVNSFRYYMFATCNMTNWQSNHLKKLKGLSRQCMVSYKTKPTPIPLHDTAISSDFSDGWYYMLNILCGDIVKTITLYDNMPNITCAPDQINDNIYAYIVSRLPGYTCLDKYISKILHISSKSTDNTTKKFTVSQLADIFQMPMLLANGLISAGYNLSSIIHMTNVVCRHNSKLRHKPDKIEKILKHGILCVESSHDIDKPVMALTEYFQNIITTFCTYEILL